MHYFFFSYSRDDNTEYLKSFYRDLDEAVRGIVGLKDVSYFDHIGNEPGDLWEPNLEAALASAKVFVAIATASYCRKEYCGKEWAAFDNRLNRYSRDKALRQVPPLIVPVFWIPPNERIAPFPRQIQERHYHLGDPKADANVKGILYLTKLKGKYEKEYEDYVGGLASRIVELAAEHSSFDKYSGVPKLADVESAFHEKGVPTPSPASGGLLNGGPRHVHFVYAAAAPSEIHNTERQDATAYGDNGGAEWQPFFPEPQPIGALAPRIASSDEINMIPHEIPLTDDLFQKVRQCESNRHLVVVVLDAWTATLQTYRQALQRLDRENYMNCGVLIPWNVLDAETGVKKEQLQKALEVTLFHRYRTNDPFLRKNIQGVAQLSEQLADLLTRLRAEVFNSPPTAQDLPRSAAKPSISLAEPAHG